MSSDFDSYFECLDALKDYNQMVIRKKSWFEEQVDQIRENYDVMPSGRVAALLKKSQKEADNDLDFLWKKKETYDDFPEFWKVISVLASQSSTPEQTERFRRKHLDIVAEQEKEASRLLDEIRDALEAVIPPNEKVLAAFYAPTSGARFELDYRWPIDGNSSTTLLRNLFSRWSWGGPHSYTWDRRYGTSGGREIPSGVKPNMISPQGVQYLLRGRGINSLRRVEVARLLHSKIPFLINRLKRCLACRMLERSAKRGRGDEKNIRGKAERLQKEYLVFKEIDDDLMYDLVKRGYLKMTFPGIHAMAVEPSLAPTEESIEEELYFRTRVELFRDRFVRGTIKWRFGINMDLSELAEYFNAEEEKREDENDGLLEAGVNADLIEAYKDFRIEKIDMLNLDKKHKKLGNDGSFDWVLELEDDLFHLKEAEDYFSLVEKIFGVKNPTKHARRFWRVGKMEILCWHALCESDEFLDGPEDFGSYLWANRYVSTIGRSALRKKSGLRLGGEQARKFAAKATKFLGIAGGIQDSRFSSSALLSNEKPLERFDAILGPYIEIDSKVSGLVEHMMDEGNGYSSDTLDIVRRILDGKMGEEERELLTSLIEGETSSGYAFDADTLYEWVERWDLLDHPEALGEILGGADFDAVVVKHGLMQ